MKYIIKVNGKPYETLSDEEKVKLKLHMLKAFKKHLGLNVNIDDITTNS